LESHDRFVNCRDVAVACGSRFAFQPNLINALLEEMGINPEHANGYQIAEAQSKPRQKSAWLQWDS